jgi:uncharacterized membrane protein
MKRKILKPVILLLVIILVAYVSTLIPMTQFSLALKVMVLLSALFLLLSLLIPQRVLSNGSYLYIFSFDVSVIIALRILWASGVEYLDNTGAGGDPKNGILALCTLIALILSTVIFVIRIKRKK